MSALLDEDGTNAAAEGLLNLQMRVGEPLKVEYRNLSLKQVK